MPLVAQRAEIVRYLYNDFAVPQLESPKTYLARASTRIAATIAFPFDVNRLRNIRLVLVFGADGRSRTGTPLGTAPSRQRVYQFHHIGNEVVGLVVGCYDQSRIMARMIREAPPSCHNNVPLWTGHGCR